MSDKGVLEVTAVREESGLRVVGASVHGPGCPVTKEVLAAAEGESSASRYMVWIWSGPVGNRWYRAEQSPPIPRIVELILQYTSSGHRLSRCSLLTESEVVINNFHMEDDVKSTMWCATCDKKHQVLEGEVTCPDCGALLEAPEDLEDVQEQERVLGVEVNDEGEDDLADEGDIE